MCIQLGQAGGNPPDLCSKWGGLQLCRQPCPPHFKVPRRGDFSFPFSFSWSPPTSSTSPRGSRWPEPAVFSKSILFSYAVDIFNIVFIQHLQIFSFWFQVVLEPSYIPMICYKSLAECFRRKMLNYMFVTFQPEVETFKLRILLSAACTVL